MSKLAEDQIKQRTAQLGKGWERLGDMLVRTWQFASPQRALEFVNQLAQLAARRNHYPDILLSYRDVRIELATHSEGGLTDADFDAAHEIDSIAIDR